MTRRQYVNFNKKEGSIHLPNEIFTDFNEKFKKRNHAAFAYSYYYLINYLYRHNKYIVNIFTQKIMKEFLGYRETNKTVDIITRENGILDTMGYTKTTTDYPIFVEVDDKNRPYFQTIHQAKKDYPELSFLNDRNVKIKFPMKAFYRNKFGMDNQYNNGTYYEPEGTHGIEIDKFITMMDDDEIGVVGFYIYGYMKCKISFNYEHYLAQSHDDIATTLGMSRTTVIKYIKTLEKKGIIRVRHQNFWDNPDRLANEYELC